MIASDLVMIVPTRGRPQSIAPIVECWEKTAAEASLLFMVDEDDPAFGAYETALGVATAKHFNIDWASGPRLRLAGTLNEAVREMVPHYAAVGFMGDDHRPRTEGWDRRFAECLSGGTGVVYGNDLLVGSKFPTAVMMTSDIPATLGYFCPPPMVHLCLDLVWKDWGDGIGRITYLHDVIIEHMHPAAEKANMDHGYAECNSSDQVSADSAAYLEYVNGGRLQADLKKLKAAMK